MRKLNVRSALTTVVVSGLLIATATTSATAAGTPNVLPNRVFSREISARAKAPQSVDSLTNTCNQLDRLIDFLTGMLETGSLNIGRARYGLTNYQLEILRQKLRDAQETYSHLQCSVFV